MGKIHEDENIMNANEADMLKSRYWEAKDKETQKKIASIQNNKALYMPKGEYELNKKSNNRINSTKYINGVNIEPNNDSFVEKMHPSRQKTLKEDKLWTLINSHAFQREMRRSIISD